MTMTTPLGKRLISLLLAFAMILAFIPAISHKAAAASDPPFSTLRADDYLYGDGWTWDGQTLQFYGSRSFDTGYTKFEIYSTKNGGAAVIDIASSITVDLGCGINFVESVVPLKITGAGTITVEGSSILFGSSGSIEYSGGAIISDDGAVIFYSGTDLTITQGYLDIENAALFAKDSINIKDSYAIIGQFNSSSLDPGDSTLEINIDKSYVDASSLYISTFTNLTTPKYTLVDSVLCSKADSSEFTKEGKPYFESIRDSVVYLPEMENIDWLGTDALSGLDAKEPVSTGGYVFCNKVLTDADRINNYFLKGSSTSGATFSGVFFDPDQKQTRDLCLTSTKITGGNLFNCLGTLSIQNLTAENATIAVISNTSDKNIELYNTDFSGYSFSSCTIAGISDSTMNSDLIIDGYNSNNCNVYSNTTNSLRTYYTEPSTSANNYYAPNGTAEFNSDYDSINANITAKCIASKNNTFVVHGNVYADSLDTSRGSLIFDGSGAYEVNIKSSDNGVEFDNSLIYVHEKSGSDWVYTEIQPDENGNIKYTGTNEIYAGGMVLNPVAGNPVFSGDPMNVSKGSPATVKVPLTYPFSNGTLDLDISLHDEDGNSLNWNDIGVTPKILNTGGEKELTLSLEANSGAKVGIYFFYFKINKQSIETGSTNEIFFRVIINYAKISFYHEFLNFSVGSDDSPTNYYTVSAEYNGSPLVKQGTGIGSYYTVPVGEYFDITLIPKDGYTLNIEYDSNYYPSSPNGTYHLPADGDKTITLRMTETGDTSYYTLDLSAELQKSLADGEISSVTVKYSDGTEKTFDSASTDFSAMVLSNEEVTISIVPAEGYSVAKINGADAVYDSKNGTYSTDITITENTTVNAAVYKADELCTLELLIMNISNPGDKVTVTPAPVNAERNEYEVGTECEIVMTITDDKFIGTSEFNGAHIDAYSLESDGCHYKVKLDKSANKFLIYYADLSVLRIPKPANGSVTFSGRLDGGRSSSVTNDGTQVYNIGSWDDVTLTLTPDSGYRVKSAKLDGKDVTITNNTCTFSIEQLVDWTFIAEFEPITHLVTVDCGDHGTITPSTSNIAEGTEVTFTVTPDEGYKVKSVTLDGKAVTLTDGKYTFTVTKACTFAAEFEAIMHTVTVDCGEHGTITPSTSTIAEGTKVTLTVTPDAGYKVKSATLDGKSVTLTDGKYTFTVTKACTFAAEFEAITHLVTVNCGEHGTITPSTSTIAEGTKVTFTVTPDAGYKIKSVTLDGKAVTLTDGKYTFTVTKACTFAAEFEAITHLVTVNCGEHGTITPSTSTIAEGTKVTFTVTPDAGYKIKSVTLGGKAVTLTDGKYTFTVTKACTLAAEFEAIMHKVTVDCGEHGTITPSTSTIAEGTKVTFTVTPDAGYKVKSVTLDGKAVTLTDGKYTFTVTKACTFAAEFEAITHLVTVDCGEHGTITPSTSNIAEGTEVTFTVTPDAGYKIKSVTLDGKAVTLTDGKYTFTVTKACTFAAEFEAIMHNVTVDCGEHGTITPSTSTIAEGTKVTLTVTPDAGYKVKSVTLDGKAVTLTDGKYTFTVTKACTFAAEFEAITHLLTVNCGEHGTITPSTSNIAEGTEVTLTVTPDAGYKVKSVTLDGKAVTLTDGKYTFTVTKACTFVAEFEAITHLVTVDCGEHGTITPSTSTVAEGTKVTITVTPDAGYKIKSVTLDGKAVTLTDGKYTFTVTKACTFAAEFEAIMHTVTVDCGEHGTVTPETSTYADGTQLTITAAPDAGYYISSATLDGKTVKLIDGKYTFTVTKDCTFAVKFAKKTSGGTSHPTTGADVTRYPSINGVEKSWAEIAGDLSKMSSNDTIHISLNGQTIVPADVIKAIRDNRLRVEFIVDSTKSRTVNGADIINAAETDLSMIAGNADKSTLRGTVGADIRTGAIGFPTDLIVKLGAENAGRYANLYKYADGKLTFIGCVKADSSGAVVIAGTDAAGEYIVMACDFSDLAGDANNDGVLNALDASAVLRHVVGIENVKNALMSDFNGDGRVNALDASAILMRVVGIA